MADAMMVSMLRMVCSRMLKSNGSLIQRSTPMATMTVSTAMMPKAAGRNHSRSAR